MFALIKEKAGKTGAKKLYISATDSIDSQEIYRKLGCVPAKWIYEKRAEQEPYDISLEYIL